MCRLNGKIHHMRIYRFAREFRKYLVRILPLLTLALAAGARTATGTIHEGGVVGTTRLEVFVEAG